MRGYFFLANVLLCSWQSAGQLYFLIHAQRKNLLFSLFSDIEIFALFTVSTTLATCCFIRGSWEQLWQNIGLPSPSETEAIPTHCISFTCAAAAACLLMHFSKHDVRPLIIFFSKRACAFGTDSLPHDIIWAFTMHQNDQYRQHRTSVVMNFKNEISAEWLSRKLCENHLHQPSHRRTRLGVGGAATPPGLKNFSAHSGW